MLQGCNDNEKLDSSGKMPRLKQSRVTIVETSENLGDRFHRTRSARFSSDFDGGKFGFCCTNRPRVCWLFLNHYST